MHVDLEFLPWLSERLGGATHRSKSLKWQIPIEPNERVADLFNRLAAGDDNFRRFVYDPAAGALHEVVVVVINDRLLDLAGGFDAALNDGDRLALVPALVGGA